VVSNSAVRLFGTTAVFTVSGAFGTTSTAPTIGVKAMAISDSRPVAPFSTVVRSAVEDSEPGKEISKDV
jgi:hypothetical protein